MNSTLTPLQRRVLQVLSSVNPRWTLTGGAALAGVYLGHRTTRDLDLFWHGRPVLAELPGEVEACLTQAGMSVTHVQRATTFCRLEVRDDGDTVVLDLVADPAPVVEAPQDKVLEDSQILVDTPHEILVNKLTALMSRSEVRDLVDIRALLRAGGDLQRALEDAPKKDGGFSPLTLAWLLEEFPLKSAGRALGMSPEFLDELDAFRTSLKQRVLDFAKQ
ncbi:MAG: nucleotidyl transferase AbiEii/AbiGii toxin family protein [Myxococcota bacterium]